MIAFFANLFGYLLNYLYEIIGNYGLAIIVFSIAIKLILLPISIKQQKTMKKTSKIQGKLKEIQEKYKNDPEKLNQETMELYKKENMSPFSGCLSAIAQLILLLSVFYLVRSPLTYMRKVDSNLINDYKTEISEDGSNTAYPEIKIIKLKGSEDERVNINMNFFGLDLSEVPTVNLSDYKVYIIPALYVVSTFISMKINNNMNGNKKKKKMLTDGTEVIENEEVKQEEKPEEENPMADTTKSMTYMMPLMSVSIALVAPLGLALYWLVNNILMILERLVLSKIIKDED